MSALRFWATWVGIIGFCVAIWLVVILLALSLMSATGYAATPRAGGGRTHCQTVPCLRRAVAWNVRERAHLEREIARKYVDSTSVAFQLAEVIYGMPPAKAHTIGVCESHLNPTARNSVTATGVMQELDSTFNATPFRRVRLRSRLIASFNTFVNILAAGYIWKRDGGSFREWDCSRITGVR